MKYRLGRWQWLGAAAICLALAALAAVYAVRAAGTAWHRVADVPTRAITTPEGDVLLVPWIGPEGPRGLEALDAVRRLTPEGTIVVADGATYKLLSAKGQPATLVVLTAPAGLGKRCAGVLWSATGERGWAATADGTCVAYTDRSSDSLYVFEADRETAVEWPTGDPGEFLQVALEAAPEGWSFQWVSRPRWLGDGGSIVFGSNRYDLDFSNGHSIWMATPGDPPRRLWAAADFGSGDHLEYWGHSVAGHLVFEAKAHRILAAPEAGGKLTSLVESVAPIALSPNGRWLAVQPDNAGALEPRLMLVDLADPSKPPFSVDAGGFLFNDYAVWSPSGCRLAFLAPSVSAPEGLAQLVVVDIAVGEPKTTLYGQPGPLNRHYPPSWAGEDRVVVVSSDGSTWFVHLQLDAGGGGL
ncbi:MAG: hypothetical protein K6T75_03025 [Acetobacteraceae bacterium]|nr:hypothetical protein [Acetobacteraceae bacterium]